MSFLLRMILYFDISPYYPVPSWVVSKVNLSSPGVFSKRPAKKHAETSHVRRRRLTQGFEEHFGKVNLSRI